MKRKLNKVEDKLYIFIDNVFRYIFLFNVIYYEVVDRCVNLFVKIFNLRDYNLGFFLKVLKLRKIEIIWIDIFREFIWRKINGICFDLNLM